MLDEKDIWLGVEEMRAAGFPTKRSLLRYELRDDDPLPEHKLFCGRCKWPKAAVLAWRDRNVEPVTVPAALAREAAE